ADASLATGWAGGPVLTDRFVAATSGDGRIHAFDRDSGKIRWSIPRVAPCAGALGSPEHDFRPLFHKGRTLFAGSLTGCVVAYDADTQRERWRYSGDDNGSTTSILGADDQTLYVPYARGRVSAFALGNGVRQWSTASAQRGFRWPPAIVGDRLYFSSS